MLIWITAGLCVSGGLSLFICYALHKLRGAECASCGCQLLGAEIACGMCDGCTEDWREVG